MRESHTAIVERHARLDAVHHTEPYECAWAGQAAFYVHASGPSPRVELQAETSVDGRRWLDLGAAAELAAGCDAVRLPLDNIDGWLRLRLTDADPDLHYDVYLYLKE